MKSHGIVIDEAKKTLTIQSNLSKVDFQYDLNFYQVDSFSDEAFRYDVYYWSAAYKTDDPYALNWAGQMGLDEQGRVVGLNEPENTFVVRSDGATIITGFEMPFDYDEINLTRNREQIRMAFSQGVNHP